MAEKGHEKGFPAAPVLGNVAALEHTVDAAALAKLLKDGKATVVDLSLSPAYRKGHIPGAWFAIRSRLKQAFSKITVAGELVLTSEDGMLAALAVAETGRPARWLRGGGPSFA